MRAAIRRIYCNPEGISIEEIQKPTIAEDEVLVHVHYTTINRTDGANLRAKPWIMRLTLGLFKPKSIILGTDFAGEVHAIGNHVKNIQVGDRIFGFNDTNANSQAEWVAVKEGKSHLIPEGVDFKTAAASLEGAHYAYSFIRRTKILPGQAVLINGATGAIGSALLQFVCQLDAKVTATSNAQCLEQVKLLGAHKVFDYSKEEFTKDTMKYDFVFDAVGKSTYGACKKLLTPNGVYISSELGPFAQNVFYALLAGFMKQKVRFPIPYPTAESVPYIIDKLKSTSFAPMIDRVYSFDDIRKAYAYVISGQKNGNVLLSVLKEDSSEE